MKTTKIGLLIILTAIMTLSLTVTALAAQSPGSQAVQITADPTIETATSNLVTITWGTNQPSGSQVWYGTDKNNLTQQAEAPYGGTTHRVQINNLQPNTTYYFQVESEHGRGGSEAESRGIRSFHTLPSGAQPVHNQKAEIVEKGLANEENGSVKITGAPVLEFVDSNSATIAWSTNLKGSTRVTYGTDPNNLTQLAEAPWGQGGLTHRAKLQNLQPNTTYYFKAETGQAQGTGGAEVESQKVMSFKTPAAGAPPIRNEHPH